MGLQGSMMPGLAIPSCQGYCWHGSTQQELADINWIVTESANTKPNSVAQISKFEDRNFIKNGVFWDVTPCGSCKKRRFGGT
jgi:hypothetical protein